MTKIIFKKNKLSERKMKHFIKDISGLRIVRKSEVAAAMINPSHIDYDRIKKTAINFILRSGEKASVIVDDVKSAKEIVAELDSH